MNEIKISIIHGDAFQIQADVMVLKYAQAPYGLDRDIIRELGERENQIYTKLPKESGFYHLGSRGITSTKDILFIGVTELRKFEYREIREFGRKALVSLASALPSTKSVLVTIHGPGYGLDEIEAFESQIAGMLDAINSEDFPGPLEEIIFVERSKGRQQRLQKILNELFPSGLIPTPKSGGIKRITETSKETLRTAGIDSKSKKRIFVAMPFASDFDDLYEYGIQGAVNSVGYLCERADLESFTGDVMDWVKKRIATADIVIADLTGGNANVYLEVGYAWGKDRETVLIVKDTKDLKFDTRGQRCIPYSSIKDLETKLTKELIGLRR